MINKTSYYIDNSFKIEDSRYMYAIAILMLVYHHLLCDPSRLKAPFVTFIPISVAQSIAIFCHLCVAIYAFISGVGFSHKIDFDCNYTQTTVNSYHDCIKAIFKLYIRYWIVFIPFVLYGLLEHYYSLNLREFFDNFFAFSSTYNNEWWYIKQYIKMLIVLPLFAILCFYFMRGHAKRKLFAAGIVLLLFVCPGVKDIWFKVIGILNIYTFILFEGFIFGELHIIEKTLEKVNNRIYVYISFLLLTVVIRMLFSNNMMQTNLDWFLAPLFIVGICGTYKSLNNMDHLKLCVWGGGLAS